MPICTFNPVKTFLPSLVPLDVFCNSLQPRLQWFWDILHPRLLTPTEPGWTHTGKDPIFWLLLESGSVKRWCCLKVLVRELVAITGRISEEELNRAKTQVLFSRFSSLLHNLPLSWSQCFWWTWSHGQSSLRTVQDRYHSLAVPARFYPFKIFVHLNSIRICLYKILLGKKCF